MPVRCRDVACNVSIPTISLHQTPSNGVIAGPAKRDKCLLRQAASLLSSPSGIVTGFAAMILFLRRCRQRLYIFLSAVVLLCDANVVKRRRYWIRQAGITRLVIHKTWRSAVLASVIGCKKKTALRGGFFWRADLGQRLLSGRVGSAISPLMWCASKRASRASSPSRLSSSISPA